MSGIPLAEPLGPDPVPGLLKGITDNLDAIGVTGLHASRILFFAQDIFAPLETRLRTAIPVSGPLPYHPLSLPMASSPPAASRGTP